MRILVTTKRFDKKLINFCKSHPDLLKKVSQVMDLIAKDYLNQKLKTHKLSGSLKECYSSSIDYSYRIVFKVSDSEIYLLNIGSHDDVY